jgi:signal transduction histidine kinase
MEKLIESTGIIDSGSLVTLDVTETILLSILIIAFLTGIIYFFRHKGNPEDSIKLKKEISSLNQKILALNSEIKTHTNNLEQALQKAEEANHLKSLFLANMNHEIRTPLNGIIGFSELIVDPEIDEDLKQEFSVHIVQNSEQLLRLIDQIFHLSIIETGKVKISREEFRIKLLLLSLEPKFQSKIRESKKNIKFYLNANLKEDKIFTDYTKLDLIIQNIFDNSLKFTNEGYIFIGYTREKNKFLFKISDTGCGIGEDEYESIFDPFAQGSETLKKAKGGSGLGLSNVKNYIILLGGKVWCEKNQPHGLTICFTLPAIPPKERIFRQDLLTLRK